MKVTITITIDDKTKEAIKKKAIAEKRTLSSQIDWILTDYVFKNLRKKVNRPTKEEYQARQNEDQQEEEEEVSNEQVEAALYVLGLNNGEHNKSPKQWWEERRQKHPENKNGSFQLFTEEIAKKFKNSK